MSSGNVRLLVFGFMGFLKEFSYPPHEAMPIPVGVFVTKYGYLPHTGGWYKLHQYRDLSSNPKTKWEPVRTDKVPAIHKAAAALLS